MEHKVATFFLSIGRCGTQSLTRFLQSNAPKIRVEHEPVPDPLTPTHFYNLTQGAPPPTPWEAHWSSIERTLHSGSYIETGWPTWAAWPWLEARFSGRVRAVHLVRDPIDNARSWMSLNAFTPPLLPYLPTKEFLTPHANGCQTSEEALSWDRQSPLEKNLWYWAEANSRIQSWKETSTAPWLTLSFESLFRGSTLKRLLDFLEIEARTFDVEKFDAFPKGWSPDPIPAKLPYSSFVERVATELGY